MRFSGSKTAVVQFVGDLLLTLNPDSVSIMITTRVKSGELYVTCVIDSSLEDTVVAKAMNYSLQLIIT